MAELGRNLARLTSDPVAVSREVDQEIGRYRPLSRHLQSDWEYKINMLG